MIYALFYVCLDKKAGSLAALLCVLCWVGASLLAGRLGFSLAWKVSSSVLAYVFFVDDIVLGETPKITNWG